MIFQLQFIIVFIHSQLTIYLRYIQMISKLINRGYSAKACEICGTEFNLIKLERIHKCKRCFKHVCHKCANNKEKIMVETGGWSEAVHRVCSLCRNELDQITHMIEQDHIAWNKQSKFAEQWVMSIQQSNSQYRHFLQLYESNSQNYEQETEIIEKDVIKGRTDYSVFNYSLKEFFYLLQQNEMQELTRNNIANVLYALAARFDQVGYVQGMSGIAAYLLCFCNEEGAFTIFCDLIENIYPSKFFIRGNYGVSLIGMMAEIHFLKEYFIHWLTVVKGPILSHETYPLEQQQLDRIRTIVELSASKALLSLFTGFLAYSNLSFVWKQIQQKRSFEVIQKAFLAILYLRRNYLIQRSNFKDLQKTFQTLNREQFIEAYYDIQIDQQIKNLSIQQYYENLSKKWAENSEYNIRNLYKYTSFTQGEIKLLQNNFIKDKCQDFRMQKSDFVNLVNIYYELMRKGSKDTPIFEMAASYAPKIYDMYNENSKSGLDFREFICCLSTCTKNKLKDQMSAIINTFEDSNRQTNIHSFSKLVQNLCEICPQSIEDSKQLFLERVRKYCENQQKISRSELCILLNDDFINQLTIYLTKDTSNLIQTTIVQYFKGKSA